MARAGLVRVDLVLSTSTPETVNPVADMSRASGGGPLPLQVIGGGRLAEADRRAIGLVVAQVELHRLAFLHHIADRDGTRGAVGPEQIANEKISALKPIPMFVDSPLAIDATSVFELHPDAFDSTEDFVQKVQRLFRFDLVRYTRDASESKELNRMRGPVRVLIPEGGMSGLDKPGGPFWCSSVALMTSSTSFASAICTS